MDFQSKRILIAAIEEKRELVQMLYSFDKPDEGLSEYIELRRLGQLLREEINGNPRADNPGIEPDTPTE
jgi:hypothetical protein